MTLRRGLGLSSGAWELLRHLAWACSGDAASKAAVLATTLIAVRQLSVAQFGAYAGLSAVSLFAASLWDLGIGTLLTRETAAGRIDRASAFRKALRLRLVTSPVWLATFAGGTLLLSRGGSLTLLTVVPFAAASCVFATHAIALAGLRGDLRFREAGVVLAAGRWLTTLASAALLLTTSLSRIEGLGLALLAGESLTLLLAWSCWLGKASPSRQSAASTTLTLRRALPFAANSLFATAYNRLDVVLVAALANSGAAGAYAAASRLQDAMYLLPSTIGTVALPVLTRAWHSAPQHATRLTLQLACAGGLLGVVGSVVVVSIAAPLVHVVLGSDYAGAIGPIRILAWFLPLALIQAPLLAILQASGRAGQTTKIFGVTLVVALAAHLTLDWWAGAQGGAAASLLRDLVAAPLALYFANRAGLLSTANNPKREAAMAGQPG